MGSLLTTLVTRPSHLSHKDFDKWNETEELSDTVRGEGGFGSTGIVKKSV